MRCAVVLLSLMLFCGQPGLGQEPANNRLKAVEGPAPVKERLRVVDEKAVAEKKPWPTAGPCVELDVLVGCVAFDARGELRVKKEGAEPEVNRAGTIGVGLTSKLNQEKGKLPAGVSAGAAGANLLLAGLGGEDKLRSLEQFRLRLSANASEVHFQHGQRVPRITGSTARSGGLVNTVTFENMGAIIGGSAQVTKGGKIDLAIQIERSGFGPEEEGTPVSVIEGQTLRTPGVDTLTIKTQATVACGEPTLLASLVRSWENQVTETFVIVAATIVEP